MRKFCLILNTNSCLSIVHTLSEVRESVCGREQCSTCLPAHLNWTHQHTETQCAPNRNQFNDVLLLFPTLKCSVVEQHSCRNKVMLLTEDADFILGFFDRSKKRKSTTPPSERLRREYNLKQRSFLASNMKALAHIKQTKSGRKKQTVFVWCRSATGQIFLAWIWKINQGSRMVFFQHLRKKRKWLQLLGSNILLYSGRNLLWRKTNGLSMFRRQITKSSDALK